MRVDCFPCIRLRAPIGLYDRAAPAGEGMVAKFMRRVYAPLLLRSGIKQFVAFGGLLLVAIIGIQHIQLGLGESRTFHWVRGADR
jgi:Niemann-Pick C1 protein